MAEMKLEQVEVAEPSNPQPNSQSGESSVLPSSGAAPTGSAVPTPTLGALPTYLRKNTALHRSNPWQPIVLSLGPSNPAARLTDHYRAHMLM